MNYKVLCALLLTLEVSAFNKVEEENKKERRTREFTPYRNPYSKTIYRNPYDHDEVAAIEWGPLTPGVGYEAPGVIEKTEEAPFRNPYSFTPYRNPYSKTVYRNPFDHDEVAAIEWGPLTPGVGYEAPGVIEKTEEAPFRNPYSKTIYRDPYNKDMVAAVEYNALEPQNEEAEVIPQDNTMTIGIQSNVEQPIISAYSTSKTLYRDPYQKDTVAAVGYSAAIPQETTVKHTVEINYGAPTEVQNEEVAVTEEAVATPYRNPDAQTVYRDPYNKDIPAAVGYSTFEVQEEEVAVAEEVVATPYRNPDTKVVYRDPYNKDIPAAVAYSSFEVRDEEVDVAEEAVATPYRNPDTKVVYRDPYNKDIPAAISYSSLQVQEEVEVAEETVEQKTMPQKITTHVIEMNYDEVPYRNPYSKDTDQKQQKSVMTMKISGYAQQYCENLNDMSPPDTSNCWNWNVPEVNFGEQKGCDYDKCAAAVCECDPFCCSDSWDLSCRGYKESPTDLFKDNPFNPGCSASILCCEQEEAVPQPPVVAKCETEGWNPPDDSTCWQWNKQGSSPSVQIGNQKGCDFDLCENAVCECDPYCCEISWDLSCRGFQMEEGDQKDNYFVSGCSAHILCCEPESAYPDPPIPPNNLPIRPDFSAPEAVLPEPVVGNCLLDGWVPPDDSTCWQWNKQGSSPQVQVGDQKGCDFELCENAVCACDPYCCDISWDLSCRGFQMSDDSEAKDNYFVSGCSAHILCCEPESAYPDPPIPPNNLPIRPEFPIPEAILPPLVDPPQVNIELECATKGWTTTSTSNCFEWVEAGSGKQKGCDNTLCEAAVCSCDPYCCETSWDHSCAGQASPGSSLLDNPFVPGCSAHMLCCNDSTAQAVLPDPTGTIITDTTGTGTGSSSSSSSSSSTVTVIKEIPVTETVTVVKEVTKPVTVVNEIPVINPVKVTIPVEKETVQTGSTTQIRVDANIIDTSTTTIEELPQAVLPSTPGITQEGKSGKSGKKSGKKGKSGKSKGKSGKSKGKSGNSKGKSGGSKS